MKTVHRSTQKWWHGVISSVCECHSLWKKVISMAAGFCDQCSAWRFILYDHLICRPDCLLQTVLFDGWTETRQWLMKTAQSGWWQFSTSCSGRLNILRCLRKCRLCWASFSGLCQCARTTSNSVNYKLACFCTMCQLNWLHDIGMNWHPHIRACSYITEWSSLIAICQWHPVFY